MTVRIDASLGPCMVRSTPGKMPAAPKYWGWQDQHGPWDVQWPLVSHRERGGWESAYSSGGGYWELAGHFSSRAAAESMLRGLLGAHGYAMPALDRRGNFHLAGYNPQYRDDGLFECGG